MQVDGCGILQWAIVLLVRDGDVVGAQSRVGRVGHFRARGRGPAWMPGRVVDTVGVDVVGVVEAGI